MFKILRDEDGGICMMDGGFITSGSQVSVLMPPSSPSPGVHWFTGTPNPSTSIYKPFFFGPGADVGGVTVSMTEKDGASGTEPGCKDKEGDNQGAHALYRGHRRLCNLMDNHEEKGHSVLGQLHQLENKCAEDVDDILANYSPESFPKLRNIFQHMASMEINFYV